MGYVLIPIFFLLFFLMPGCSKPKLNQLIGQYPSLRGEPLIVDNIKSNVQYILINVFAPKCPPCIEEIPQLRNLHKKLPSSVKIFGFGTLIDVFDSERDVSIYEIKSEVSKFEQEYPVEYPIYLVDLKWLKEYSIAGFPETLLFERSGSKWVLKQKWLSVITSKMVLEKIKSIDPSLEY